MFYISTNIKGKQEKLNALDYVISYLATKARINNYNNAYNDLRRRAEALRNKLLRGERINSQDFKDIAIDLQRLPQLQKVYEKGIFCFNFGRIK